MEATDVVKWRSQAKEREERSLKSRGELGGKYHQPHIPHWHPYPLDMCVTEGKVGLNSQGPENHSKLQQRQT
ncbi:hypothetical protein AAMO2058_001373400, partial [Amorphochlora amoebiformis]